MRARNIVRKVFCDDPVKEVFAYKIFMQWLVDNPDTEVFTISDYCDNNNIRFIIVYHEI